MGTRFAFHTSMSQSCITGWLQTTNSPSHFALLTLMWHSRSWRKTRRQFLSVSRNSAPVECRSWPPTYPKDQMPTSRRHRRRQCQSVVCARAHGERRRSGAIPAEDCLCCLTQKLMRPSTSLFSLRFCHSLLPNSAAPPSFNTGPLGPIPNH